MLICVSLLIVAVVLVATGVGFYVFLPLVLCTAMMGAMMWMMMRPRGGHGGDN
ncbi:MAG: hypothetical protein Q8K79_17810 [Solirubrobacteraceae bacterium]|nr:hypothetical protein [Solirubrobacteraceae bacterium]